MLSSGDTVYSHIFVRLLFGHRHDHACPSGSERTSSGRPSEHIANGTWKQRWVRLDARIHFHQKKSSQFPHPNSKAKIRYPGGKTEEENNPISKWAHPLLSDEPRGASRSFQELHKQHLQLQPIPSYSEWGYPPMPCGIAAELHTCTNCLLPPPALSQSKKKTKQTKLMPVEKLRSWAFQKKSKETRSIGTLDPHSVFLLEGEDALPCTICLMELLHKSFFPKKHAWKSSKNSASYCQSYPQDQHTQMIVHTQMWSQLLDTNWEIRSEKTGDVIYFVEVPGMRYVIWLILFIMYLRKKILFSAWHFL